MIDERWMTPGNKSTCSLLNRKISKNWGDVDKISHGVNNKRGDYQNLKRVKHNCCKNEIDGLCESKLGKNRDDR